MPRIAALDIMRRADCLMIKYRVLLALFFGALVLPAAVAARPDPLIGRVAPDFVLKGLDGTNRRLSEYRGQVVLVNFWARWAGASRQEMPELEKIHATYERAGLVVLGVSIDEDVVHAREFSTAVRVSYPILFDSGAAIGASYGIEKLPMTVLVDRGGIIRYTHVGFKRGDLKACLETIRELLRE